MNLYTLRFLLSATLVAGVIAGCGCNGDDPPQPPRPTGLIAVNGEFYHGEMGSTLIGEPLEFGVKNSSGDFVVDQWIHFSLLEGDGALSADSIKSGSDGLVTLEYHFSGSLGHATIRAIARNLDSTEVYLRANVLIPGAHGQGQYVLLDDTYGDVVDFNGPPVSLDVIAEVEIIVANYEATLGVVFVIWDLDTNGVLARSEPVFSVIVVDSVYPQLPDSSTNSVRYEGTTVDGIGIGSLYWDDIEPVYGQYDNISFQPDQLLPALLLTYDSLNLSFWCHPPDTSVYQIDITEGFDAVPNGTPPSVQAIDSLMRLITR